jgi:hypothetical protein
MFCSLSHANEYVQGYYKKDGSYVQGHYRSAPDEYRYNNRDSQSNGGKKRDEYTSDGGATNRGNSTYNLYDNDRDRVNNRYDRKPEIKKSW